MAEQPLTSMKRPKAGHPGSEMAMPAATASEQPAYGYGLMLRLETFELEKLKIRSLPEVGQKYRIVAERYVDNVHESQSTHNQGDRSVGIQLTELAVSATRET